MPKHTREPNSRLPFWRHHKGAPQNCPWWTGDPQTTDGASGSQFDGAQESLLHKKLKQTVAELLRIDPLTEPNSVIVDEYLSHEGDRKRPDVRAQYDGRPIAVEIQLATTQIPIIVAREDFYKKEGRNLIWLTWNFLPAERDRLLTTFEDIFYSHNKNLFSLDEEVIAQSRLSSTFLMRAFWEHGSGWQSKTTSLQDLQWPVNGLPYAVAPPAPWHIEFRQHWLEATTANGTQWSARRNLFAELVGRLNQAKINVTALEDMDAESLINTILSFVAGKPVGSAQSNLIEVFNTFLEPKRRAKYARVMRNVVTQTVGAAFLDRKSVAEKLSTALNDKQDEPDSITGKVALLLFPELFQKSS